MTRVPSDNAIRIDGPAPGPGVQALADPGQHLTLTGFTPTMAIT